MRSAAANAIGPNGTTVLIPNRPDPRPSGAAARRQEKRVYSLRVRRTGRPS
jgi:hypothetical protein